MNAFNVNETQTIVAEMDYYEAGAVTEALFEYARKNEDEQVRQLAEVLGNPKIVNGGNRK